MPSFLATPNQKPKDMNFTFCDLLELRIAVIARLCDLIHKRHKHQAYRDMARENIELLRKLRTVTRENYL
jgi:hypothetical protein